MLRHALATGLVAVLAAAPVVAQEVTLVAPNTAGCLPSGFGNTSSVSFAFHVTFGFGSFAPVPAGGCVEGWPGGYGTLPTAFWSHGVGGSLSADVLQVTATAVDPSMTVTFRSMLTGEWSRGAGTVHTVRVYALSGLLLFDASQTLTGSTDQEQTLSWAPEISAVGGLRVQWGADPWYVGGNNLRFTVGDAPQNVVPEPSTYALVATGLAGLGAFRRRRARSS